MESGDVAQRTRHGKRPALRALSGHMIAKANPAEQIPRADQIRHLPAHPRTEDSVFSNTLSQGSRRSDCTMKAARRSTGWPSDALACTGTIQAGDQAPQGGLADTRASQKTGPVSSPQREPERFEHGRAVQQRATPNLKARGVAAQPPRSPMSQKAVSSRVAVAKRCCR